MSETSIKTVCGIILAGGIAVAITPFVVMLLTVLRS